MEAQPWIWAALSLLSLLAVAYYLLLWPPTKKNETLPPGPPGLPILGHLHLLGKNPHHDLHKLSLKYGPIMSLRFGPVPIVIVASPHAAEQFLKTHDLTFVGRPPHEAAKHISYEQRNLSFAQYGPYWRNMRKLCTLELLSALKINSFQPMRKQELGFLVKSIREAAVGRVAVDLSGRVSSLNADMSCLMVFGKKYMDTDIDPRGFKAVIQEGMQLAAAPNLGDYFPVLGWLDLQGLTRRFKKISKVFDDFFERIIDEHERGRSSEGREEGQPKDFVDIMMGILDSGETEFQFNRCHVKAILLDMLAASMDTSATAIEWILSLLFKHPRVMKKVQSEIERAVPMDRPVEESDLDGLEYLDMVIKESFRLHPVAPMLLPHEALHDCTVDGFHIPRKARVVVNVWSIGRDPDAWPEPEEFLPERFEGSSVDLRGRDFQLLPFGSGRRGCPGMQLGLTVVRLVVAQLMHCFDWELPGNMSPEELDMTEEFGLVMARATPLMAIPTYRLNK